MDGSIVRTSITRASPSTMARRKMARRQAARTTCARSRRVARRGEAHVGDALRAGARFAIERACDRAAECGRIRGFRRLLAACARNSAMPALTINTAATAAPPRWRRRRRAARRRFERLGLVLTCGVRIAVWPFAGASCCRAAATAPPRPARTPRRTAPACRRSGSPPLCASAGRPFRACRRVLRSASAAR